MNTIREYFSLLKKKAMFAVVKRIFDSPQKSVGIYDGADGMARLGMVFGDITVVFGKSEQAKILEVCEKIEAENVARDQESKRLN